MVRKWAINVPFIITSCSIIHRNMHDCLYALKKKPNINTQTLGLSDGTQTLDVTQSCHLGVLPHTKVTDAVSNVLAESQ